MQEVAQESNAIEYRDFDTARFVILGAGVFPNVICHRLSRNEDVILNVPSLRGDFLERAVNVAALSRRRSGGGEGELFCGTITQGNPDPAGLRTWSNLFNRNRPRA